MPSNPSPNYNKIPHMSPKIQAIGTMIQTIKHPEDTFNSRMQPKTSLPANRISQFLDVSNDVRYEKTTYAPPTFVSKGSINTISGGILTLYDSTGGTKVLTYNPTTGAVTITGSLTTTTSNTGTYNNITITGADTLTGTLSGGMLGTNTIQGGTVANATIGTPNIQNGTVGTALTQGGTVNPTAYQSGGVAGVTGTAIYVKTVNFAGSTTTLGTIISTGGIITTIN